MNPPVAAPRAHVRDLHGLRVEDPWYWLRDREDPEVLEYLKAENRFAEHQMAHTTGLQHAIFDEIKARTQETDLSVPARR